MKKRNIICAYCGNHAHASTEHAMAKWIGEAATTHVVVTPAMRRHKWGGVATVRDVCVHCNNTELSRLDEAAKLLVKRAALAPPCLSAHEATLLARWGGKVAFNMQRLRFREGTQGQEPLLPESAVVWILGKGPSEEIRVAASWISTSEPVRENYGAFGSNGTPLPRRYVQVGPIVLFVAWALPKQPESTMLIHSADCDRVPAVAVSHPAGETVKLPTMGDTSMLLKGLGEMPEITAELLRRLDEIESRDLSR
jgi:hypothetical protein